MKGTCTYNKIFPAKEALNGLHDSPKHSIIISGISGSGKTRTSASLIEYLCETTALNDSVKLNVPNAGPVLEAFGNAKTSQNSNSSRFCRYIAVFFITEMND